MTPAFPWFRMYCESRMDPKLDALNDREFRIWHKLLCLASESEDRGSVDYLDPEYVAMNLRVGVDELDSAISRMVRLRLIERTDEHVIFSKFASRQYVAPSDMPAATRDRKRRSRANVTQSRRDELVTARDVTTAEQSRADTEAEQMNVSPLISTTTRTREGF